MGRSVIALLTDFGLCDHYVGAMKGVILGICPDATLVDISHDLPPHDVLAGTIELGASYAYFPAGTIFLVVVDPGVGSARRGIAADVGAYRFVAPDNGVLSAVVDEHPPRRVVELSDRRYARPTVSRTFEGRDRFAPAAAWLARGVDLGALAAVLAQHAGYQPSSSLGRSWRGAPSRSSRQPGDQYRSPHFDARRPIEIRAEVAGEQGRLHVCGCCAWRDLRAFGSTDQLEIAAGGASAAGLLDLGRGAPVHVVIA